MEEQHKQKRIKQDFKEAGLGLQCVPLHLVWGK